MKIKRWSLLARVTHWLLFIGVTAGFITGIPIFLGIKDPIYSNPDLTRTIHYYLTTIPLIIAVPLVIMRAIEVLYRHAGEESWWPGWRDIRVAIKITLHWFKLSKEYPKIGFHHPMEKVLILLVHTGVILLGVSGIPMAFFEVPAELRNLFILTHMIGFILVSIPLAGHFMLAINPVNREALKAMFTSGEVSREWAEKHHPEWIEKIKEVEARKLEV